MPGLKDFVDQAAGVITVPAPAPRPTEPPRSHETDRAPLYGIGPGRREPTISQLQAHRDRLLRERQAQNPYYVEGEIRPDRAHAIPAGSPEAFKNATGAREAQLLWKDNRVLREYERYLTERGVTGDELDDIMRDVMMQQKKAREAEYAKPVTLEFKDE